MKKIYYATVFLITALLITVSCASKSPLIVAASKGNSSTVQKLISEGANINQPDSNGVTPLMYAMSSRKPETALTLINLGADINTADKDGKTALIYAADQGDIESMKLLIAKGAKIYKRDRSGWHAIFYANYNGYYNAVKLLFLADKAMEKGGIQEVNKICNNFKEDLLSEYSHLYEAFLNYRYLNPKINYKGNKKLLIIVRDQRPYVLSKEKEAGYVGIFRERGLMRPYIYNIGTLSRKPLADDFTYCIAAALDVTGFTTGIDLYQNQAKPHILKEKPASSNIDRIVTLEIQEWMTDKFSATGLYYDVTLKIFDGNDKLLASTHAQGQDNLVGDSSRSMYEIVPTATEAILSKMLNAPDIVTALKD